MCFSTSYLLSKCGTPVCRLAEPTEVKTRCTPRALAASAAATPCRVSASVPPRIGVVIAKREVAPSGVVVSAAVCSSDGARSVARAFASDIDWVELGSRVTARTLWPRSRRPRATAPPWLPVDPVTTTMSWCAMFCFLSTVHSASDVLREAWGSWNYVSHARDNRGRSLLVGGGLGLRQETFLAEQLEAVRVARARRHLAVLHHHDVEAVHRDRLLGRFQRTERTSVGRRHRRFGDDDVVDAEERVRGKLRIRDRLREHAKELLGARFAANVL